MNASSIVIAALTLATLSIAPANAERTFVIPTMATTTGNCSTTTWPAFSAVQCTKPYAHSYAECTTMIKKLGNDSTSARWWCSQQGFKN